MAEKASELQLFLPQEAEPYSAEKIRFLTRTVKPESEGKRIDGKFYGKIGITEQQPETLLDTLQQLNPRLLEFLDRIDQGEEGREFFTTFLLIENKEVKVIFRHLSKQDKRDPERSQRFHIGMVKLRKRRMLLDYASELVKKYDLANIHIDQTRYYERYNHLVEICDKIETALKTKLEQLCTSQEWKAIKSRAYAFCIDLKNHAVNLQKDIKENINKNPFEREYELPGRSQNAQKASETFLNGIKLNLIAQKRYEVRYGEKLSIEQPIGFMLDNRKDGDTWTIYTWVGKDITQKTTFDPGLYTLLKQQKSEFAFKMYNRLLGVGIRPFDLRDANVVATGEPIEPDTWQFYIIDSELWFFDRIYV